MNFRALWKHSKNDRFIAIKKHTIFYMQPDSTGKNNFFEIAAFADEVFDGVAVGDADYVLFDDRAIVKGFGDVMAGCSDQLYAALEGLVIGPGADERR